MKAWSTTLKNKHDNKQKKIKIKNEEEK